MKEFKYKSLLDDLFSAFKSLIALSSDDLQHRQYLEQILEDLLAEYGAGYCGQCQSVHSRMFIKHNTCKECQLSDSDLREEIKREGRKPQL